MLKRAFSSMTCLSALSAACRRARWAISEAMFGHKTPLQRAISNFLIISRARCNNLENPHQIEIASKSAVFGVYVVHAKQWGFTPNNGGSRMFHACFTRFHAPLWPSDTCLELKMFIPLDTVLDIFWATFICQSSLHTAQGAPVRM